MGVRRRMADRKTGVLMGSVLFAVVLTACSASGSEHEILIPNNSYMFEPTELTISSGSAVTLSVTNEDRRRHDFAVVREVFDDEEVAREATEADPDVLLGVTDILRQDESGTLTLTFDEPGTYQFFCRVFGHFRAGMRGTITVEG